MGDFSRWRFDWVGFLGGRATMAVCWRGERRRGLGVETKGMMIGWMDSEGRDMVVLVSVSKLSGGSFIAIAD